MPLNSNMDEISIGNNMGKVGDKINAVLSACALNLKKILKNMLSGYSGTTIYWPDALKVGS